MTGLVVFFLVLVGFAACFFEGYYLLMFLRSGCGKYPPFILSFGKAKEVVLKEAEKVLAAAAFPLKIVDLGCGSGTLLIPLARQFPQHQFVGYDWDFIPFCIAKWKCRKLSNVQIFHKNFLKPVYDNTDLVLCYTSPFMKEILGKKLQKELKEGSVVISEAFSLSCLENERIIEANTYKMPIKVYIYERKP